MNNGIRKNMLHTFKKNLEVPLYYDTAKMLYIDVS